MARIRRTPEEQREYQRQLRELQAQRPRPPPIQFGKPKTIEEFVDRLGLDKRRPCLRPRSGRNEDDGGWYYKPKFTPKFMVVRHRKMPTKLLDQPLKQQPTTTTTIMSTFMSVISRDVLLSYLAPHEILSLWRTCKNIWESSSSSWERHRVMLQSVFQYLRISQECAEFVQTTYDGGWKAFLPRLVSMCEYLQYKVYGMDLQPDLAHRCYIAEQACFWAYDDDSSIPMGELARYEFLIQEKSYGWVNHQSNSNDEQEEQRLVPVPTLKQLYTIESREIAWGHPEFMQSYGGGVTGNELAAWFEEHRRYMQNEMMQMFGNNNNNRANYPEGGATTVSADDFHVQQQQNMDVSERASTSTKRSRDTLSLNSDDDDDDGDGDVASDGTKSNNNDSLIVRQCFENGSNEIVRNRLMNGLHPVIWLSYDSGSETVEYYAGIGSSSSADDDDDTTNNNTEDDSNKQAIGVFSSYYNLPTRKRNQLKHTFATCFLREQSMHEPICSHLRPNWSDDFSGGILGFILSYPCSPSSMQERNVTLGICIWCVRHGIPPFTNTSFDDWMEFISELTSTTQPEFFGDCEFYKDALTNCKFGPADYSKYTANVLEKTTKNIDGEKE